MTAIGTQNVIMDRSDLLEIELATLFRVSQVLSRPCPLWETLDQVLRILHEYGELHRGVVSLVDPDSGALLVSAIHDQPKPPTGEPVRYLPGEGVLGMVLERGERVMLPRLAGRAALVCWCAFCQASRPHGRPRRRLRRDV